MKNIEMKANDVIFKMAEFATFINKMQKISRMAFRQSIPFFSTSNQVLSDGYIHFNRQKYPKMAFVMVPL